VIEDTDELPSLPNSWAWTRLEEIGIVASGGTPSTSVPEYFEGDVPWITPADLSSFTSKFIQRGRRNISEKGLHSSSAVLLPAGTILFSSRAPIGYVAIAANPIATNQGFKNLVLCEGVFNEYVFHYLKASKKLAESYGSGTTFREVSASRFRLIPIPLAPYNEQRRIVVRLEELFACLDAGVEGLRKVKAQLKRYRQAVLKYAFEGKLTEEWRRTHKHELEPATKLLERTRRQRGVDKERNTHSMEENLPKLPEEWTWTTIGELAEINPRLTNENLPADLEVSFLPMKAVEEKSGKFDSLIVRKYEEVKRGYTSFEDGDVLFAKITPCMENGKIAVVEKLRNGIGFGSTEFHVIRPRANETPRKLFFYYLLMDGFRKDAQRNMTGSAGQLRVSARYLQNAAIPLCSFEEQHKIVEEVEFRFLITEEVAEIIDTTLLHSEQMRQSILKTAFEGKLVPQDPNDEPAEKLLEHIRAERTKSKGEKDTKRGNKNEPKQLELSSYVK